MKKIILLSLVFLFMLVFNFVLADEALEAQAPLAVEVAPAADPMVENVSLPEPESKPKTIQAIEFLSGYGWGHLRGQNHYQSIPFIVDIDYNFKALTKKIGFNPPMLFQFQLEPFANWVYGPYDNIETGLGLMLKIGLVPETWKFQPYIKGGSAPSFSSLHMREEGSQFNFISSACAGFHYSLTSKTAFTAEYRYRHLSNASIASPNSGVNTQLLLAGIMYSF